MIKGKLPISKRNERKSDYVKFIKRHKKRKGFSCVAKKISILISCQRLIVCIKSIVMLMHIVHTYVFHIK